MTNEADDYESIARRMQEIELENKRYTDEVF